ncbi:DNA sulfur modification protein DndB [Bacillus sp. FJAT-22090]|uniref:DNA sulfur modification protein DndB n=1 Tax=Bacillus sp. FJAT-22090 TaxID=1581038 RepID=UPI0011A55D0E|nr:DNA sulfur modification protein DndB [Bacillus sp. FJAT-22090]
MKKNKAELLEVIKDKIQYISDNRKAVDEIKDELANYRITDGRVEEVLNNPDVLDDMRELALFTEQFYVKTGLQDFNPDNWFEIPEMKEARQYDYIFENTEEEMAFPIEYDKSHPIGRDVFSTIMSYQEVAELMKNQLLNYNFEIQREAKQIKRHDHFIMTPTINKKNVKEMRDLILKGELKNTMLAFNAAPRTSDLGEELDYDNKKNILTITEGTRLDILDGFHRCLASQQAYEINPDLDFNFVVMVSNYTTKEAQNYQVQLSKATPIPLARAVELAGNRYADDVVKILKSDSELKGRVTSAKGRLNITAGDLVSYTVLADAINREFNIKVKLDVYEVSDYLKKFFEYLIGNFPEEFSVDRNTKSLMAYNKMFAGYIGLAAAMKEQNIELTELKLIIEDIDFDRDNPIWEDVTLIKNKGEISNRIDERRIGQYFRKLVSAK